MVRPVCRGATVSQHNLRHSIRLVLGRAQQRATAFRSNFHLYNLRQLAQRAASAPLGWSHRHWIAAGSVLLLTIAAGVLAPNFANATRDPNAFDVTKLDLPLPPLDVSDIPTDASVAADAGAAADDLDWTIVTVRSGQTVGDIFRQQGMRPNDLQRLIDDHANVSALRNI